MRKLEANKVEAPVIDVPAHEQAELLAKMDPLTSKALSVIGKAIVAKKVCGMCLAKNPQKVNSTGRCISCDGVGLLDDFDKNKWAAEQVLGRKLPMPKAVEMRISDNKDKEELASAFRDLKKDDVDAMLETLNKQIKANNRKEVTLHEVVDEAVNGVDGAD